VKPKFKRQHEELAPLPMIINEEKEYEVKEVRKHRKQGKETQYLMYWKDYGNKHDQWIAEKELSHTREVIEDYWTRYLS